MASADGGGPAFVPGSAAVVWNPVAGRPRGRRRARRIVERLRALAYDVHATRRAGHAAELARQAVASGARALVVLGGDGTLREAISAVDARVPFAFHPSGTINLFARALAIPRDPGAWLDLLASGPLRDVYLARCNGAPFLSVASAGFDASVVARVNPRLKRWLQEGAYGLRALAELPRFSPADYDVRIDGAPATERGPLVGVLVGKGPYYGGRHRLLPGADPSVPSLEVALVAGTRRRDLVRLAAGFLAGTLARSGAVTRLTARSVSIEASPPAAVQVDGEAHGTTPVGFDVEPAPRRALAPPAP